MKTTVLLILFLLYSPVSADSSTYDPVQTALALNYSQMSLARIINYNDKVVIDQEYNNIINNINLRQIEDREVIELLTRLMGLMTARRIDEGDRYWVTRQFEKAAEEAVYSAFTGGVGMIAGVAMHAASGDYSRATTDLTRIGMQYFNYRKMIETAQDSMEMEKWALDRSVIRELDYMRQNMLRISWELLRRHNIPDEWRLTESQIERYIDALRDDDMPKRLRNLLRMREEFKVYPPFWYYLGYTAQQVGDLKLAIESYEKFEDVRKGIFRNDSFYASLCLNRIALLDIENDREAIKRDLVIIQREAPYDGNLILFCALTYIRLNEIDRAKELLQKNIDNSYQVSLSNRLLGEISLHNMNQQELVHLLDEMARNDNIRNQDLLYLVGQAPDKALIQRMADQITETVLTVEEVRIRSDHIIAVIPVRWYFDDVTVSLIQDGSTHEPSRIDVDKIAKTVKVHFSNVFNLSHYLENGETKLFQIVLDHKSYPVTLSFTGFIHDEIVETLAGQVAASQRTPESIRGLLKRTETTKPVRRLEMELTEVISPHRNYTVKNGVILNQ